MYNSLCILRCVRKKMFTDLFTLSMAHHIEYGQPITPARFSYLVGIMLSLIKCYYLTSVTLVMAHFIFK